MGLLDGKNVLVFGLANKNSIAWGIIQAMHREGANIGISYAIEQLEKRVMPLAESIGVDFVERCDVSKDDEIDAVFEKYEAKYGKLDILVHAIAFANREDIDGLYVDTSREGFATSLDISVYSLVALAQRAMPLMKDGGAILTLSYYGAEKVMPHYNVMGVAKAALEASVRYLAVDLGPKNIRVNAISAGPIKTLSGAGIAGFRKLLAAAEEFSPIRRLVTQEEVGNMALALCSDLGSAVTGDVVYVDGGLSVLGMPAREEDI